MIELQKMNKRNFRTFGWVQDPSDFESLFKVVSIFDEESETHKELLKNRISFLIEERDGRNHFIEELRKKPLKLKYSDLIGTAFYPRKDARCNGIVQATIEGQKRKFISDWPADNFIRWAQCLGFIKYNYYDDTFEITEKGLKWTRSIEEKSKEEILEEAILSYPPAVRILKLLLKGNILTKFEIGKQLGFIGEDGFTSLSQEIVVKTLATSEYGKEKNKIRTDTEGSADKYARMIAKWLQKLGLLQQVGKDVKVNIGKDIYKENIGQAYIITAKGIKALNKVDGKSKYKKIPKNVSWEMLSTKGNNRNYIRTRRAFVLKILIENKKGITLKEIIQFLKKNDLFELDSVIKDDIEGLINIGLNIEIENNKYYFKDIIEDFIIPIIDDNVKSNFNQEKDELREKLDTLSHEYLYLLDLAYDSKQNKLFEMKILELLINECGYRGLHLGGVRKPDGIIYTEKEKYNYGVIIDTKAYSKGYNLPIGQIDEMIRYIIENNERNIKRNTNCWWNNFEKNVNEFYFSFISGEFTGNIEEKLNRIFISTNIKGNAMSVKTLLYLANEIKAKRINYMELVNYFNNKVY